MDARREPHRVRLQPAGIASDLHSIDAHGKGAEEPLYKSNQNKFVLQVLSDGVVFREDRNGDEDRRLWLLPLTKGAKPQRFVSVSRRPGSGRFPRMADGSST